MSKEEPNLSACMQKLKIMPRPKPAKTFRDEELPIKFNPFARRLKSKRAKTPSNLSLFGASCACKKSRIYTKKPTNFKSKILRDPIIIFEDDCKHRKKFKPKDSANKKNSKLFGENISQQDFKSIIAGCEQLSLAGSSETPNFPSQNFRDSRIQSRSEKNNVNNSSCSQQAMARLCLNPPCDVTIDELASYFETFVHIPKKMSSMAEMMYI